MRLPLCRLGKISLRRAGRIHHLGVGAAHAGSVVTILIDPDTVTVINQDTGEVLSRHIIDPDRNYWRNQQKAPADGQGVTNDSTHLSHMTRLITKWSLGDSNP